MFGGLSCGMWSATMMATKIQRCEDGNTAGPAAHVAEACPNWICRCVARALTSPAVRGTVHDLTGKSFWSGINTTKELLTAVSIIDEQLMLLCFNLAVRECL